MPAARHYYQPLLMEICIVYLSSSVGLFAEEELSVILEQSRRNNALTGITGVMLYVRGSIIQVLEGEKAAVDALYQRIEQDRRHQNVTRVLSRPLAARLFSNWSMGYETITVRQLDALKNILNVETGSEAVTEAQDNIILKTIKVFYDTNHYN